MPVETLYAIPSVNCYINEDLIVYAMNDRSEPDLSKWNELENLTSEFVNRLNTEDNSLISELIFWKVRFSENINN